MPKKPNTLHAFVLAGGKSTRMGTDKGLVLHLGKPFVVRIIEAIQSHSDSITIISNTSNYNYLGYPILEDLIKNKGPLAGIYTGLKHSSSQKNLFVSCDIPLLNNAVINYLISHADYSSDASVLIHNNNIEPLCGIYNKKITETLKSLIEEDKLSVISALQHLNVHYIDVSNVDGITPDSLKNINTKTELIEIEKHLMGKVNVTLFGVLAELAGNSNLIFENVNNTNELKNALTSQFPEFAKYNLLLANNNIFIHQNTPLKNGDSVSVMPPFSGG